MRIVIIIIIMCSDMKRDYTHIPATIKYTYSMCTQKIREFIREKVTVKSPYFFMTQHTQDSNVFEHLILCHETCLYDDKLPKHQHCSVPRLVPS